MYYQVDPDGTETALTEFSPGKYRILAYDYLTAAQTIAINIKVQDSVWSGGLLTSGPH